MVGQAGSVSVPALVVQGTSDVVTPPAGAQRVYEALGGPKELWLTDSNHGGSIRDYPAEYESRVVAFLDAAVGG